MKAHIDPSAKVGKGTVFGMNTLVMERVEIGANCQIGHNVVIHAGTKIGNNVRIDDNTVVGKLPMRAAFSTLKSSVELEPAVIGDNCLVGTQVVIYAGSVLGNKILVADQASIREDVKIGDCTIVGRGVAVENHTTIGSYVKLETGCYVTAHTVIEDGCFIAPMVTMTNDNFMGRTEERFKHTKGAHIKLGGRVGANSTLMPGLVIGEDGIVAAGSVATRDVPAYKIVLGAPAKVWRDTPEEQLLKNQPHWKDIEAKRKK
jgi:UDP-2-acetamido-3-amino-2,3-dideoxy-glucuronate N-acetyltransferase